MRLQVHIIVASACVSLTASALLRAQAPSLHDARVGASTCDYDHCALRITTSRKPQRRWIVQGLSADSSRVEFTMPALTSAVHPVPEAAAEVTRAHGWFRAGGAALGVSIAAAIVLAIGPVRHHNPSLTFLATSVLVLPVVGVGALAGGVMGMEGQRHVDHAVAAYNATLPR